MCEQERNQDKEESMGAAEFTTPDCCAPMMARMADACGPESSKMKNRTVRR